MMVAIGFRASPKQVTCALVKGSPSDIQSLATFAVQVPQALDLPRQFQFVRSTLLDVMEEHGATQAGLRLTETVALRRNHLRESLEGVIQELLASSTVERFIAVQIAGIAGFLRERDRTIIKRWIEGELTPAYAPQWLSYSTDEREAILVAVAAMHAGIPTGAALQGGE